ncbi:MAG: ATP-grasp domain-containing protein [Clostridiales bacterium]|nr:ATP-grasp domain-containing protein [Clostridiales bacterium]
MKKVVIIGANDFQNPLILKAKEMGYETHVFAWQDGSIGEKTADYFYPISIIEKDAILEECKKIKPDAVVTIASDLANITVQYLAKNLGLPCNSDECINISTNKYLMRCALKKEGVGTPYFATVNDAKTLEKDKFSFPVIVKPTDRSGSRGITKVLDENGLDNAIKASVEQSFEKMAIVEEYIEGPEYSCECISYQGKHTMLAITKKFTTGAPNFIETGHLEPANLDKNVMLQVQKEIFKGLDALKIKFGASHSEFRITPQGDIRIIEIGSRMGGDCIGSDLVRLSTGYDFVKMVIEVALGQEPDLTPVKKPEYAAIRFVFEKKDIEILEKIRNHSSESLFFVSDIQPIGDHKIVDSGTRFGFFIITAPDYNKIIELSELSE